ncbi:hypothetical protein [Bacteriophage sp.]|nr:hypothetical protein [Bacteriophage sp.]
MRNKVAKTPGEKLLLHIVKMPLIAKENHLVAQQQTIDRGYISIRQVAIKSNILDFGTNTAVEFHYIEFESTGINKICMGHRTTRINRLKDRGGQPSTARPIVQIRRKHDSQA